MRFGERAMIKNIRKLMKNNEVYVTSKILMKKELVYYFYCIYLYFRWIDDYIDMSKDKISVKRRFLGRQKDVLDGLYGGKEVKLRNVQERAIKEVIHFDLKHGKLKKSIYLMFSIFDFDLDRYKKLPKGGEYQKYSHDIGYAYQEWLLFFTGNKYSGFDPSASIACHYAHVLRDFVFDLRLGYKNISKEDVITYGLDLGDVGNQAFRKWVKGRIKIIEDMFRQAKKQAKRYNLRYQILEDIYILRFKMILDEIKKDDYVIAEKSTNKFVFVFLAFLLMCKRICVYFKFVEYCLPLGRR